MTFLYFSLHLSADENFLPTSRPDDNFDNMVSSVEKTDEKNPKKTRILNDFDCPLSGQCPGC